MATTISGGHGQCSSPRLVDAGAYLPRTKSSRSNVSANSYGDRNSHGTPGTARNHQTPLVLDAAQAHWHLDLLGRDERDTNIRMIPHKGLKRSAINANFAWDLDKVAAHQSRGYGAYLQPNPGGTRASEITAGIALFIEHDDMPKQDQIMLWERLSLPRPTFQIDTGGKSIHQYFVLSRPIAIDRWTELMDRLIAHTGSDRSCRGANRMMRMAGSWYIDCKGNATVRSQIINASGDHHDAELFDQLLPEPTIRHRSRNKQRPFIGSTPRNLRQITEALDHIPQRVGGNGTYGEYRNILWGLIAACSEAGYSQEVAIDLMEDHSPSDQCGWDVRQVAESGGEQFGAGTFWWHAQQHGWRVRYA